ncbi:MAG: ribonuclease HII [Bacteroidetes bacterium RIFCSPLOWO2_02_FULL_36_8]|nr:MAG: ribonuclease HII [Bacteroidetes bacterium RIFCSPLOWO2_02_FULL_36_8]OFY70816.1 MAG: ribonuclease HII [Bacteroidetes bacterium RIFCSPLOWO2_12_FULL_37_12]
MFSQYQNKETEAGLDEAGRGALAGPVVAAAVILPPDYYNEHIDDSKVLTAKERTIAREIILKDCLAWSVAEISNTEIDRINVLNATFKAMHKCIEQLKLKPGFLIIDGNRFKHYKNFPFKCVVDGDANYFSIAAASILAKTHRDAMMKKFAEKFPEYGWEKNMGYGTQFHLKQLQKAGVCSLHRFSFKPVMEAKKGNKQTKTLLD